MAGGIWSAINGILSAGVGVTDGIGSIFKVQANEVAESIAKHATLDSFTSLGLKAGKNFTVEFRDPNDLNKVLNKRDYKIGDTISARTNQEMEDILRAARNGSNKKFSEMVGEVGSNNAFTTSRKISQADIDKLGSDNLKNAANAKNEKLKNILNAFDEVNGGNYATDFNSMATDANLRTLLGRTEQQKGLGTLNVASKGYFGDADKGSARIKGTVGTIGAGAVGIRFLSGGDLTHNPRGENDIAGIPFF